MNDTVVTLNNVHKRFGAIDALRGFTLAVHPGEVIAFLGPNGAGKTTAISIMLGLRAPTSGSVTLFGLSPRDTRARSRIGVMLQESGIPTTLTIRELIDNFRSYYPVPLPTNTVLEIAGLNEVAGRLVGALSGGQKQRVYFALAMCGNPDVLFLDEPTVGLDVETRRSFWDQVRGYSAAGKTVLLTTHYLEEADALASRVIVINKGELIAEGTPAAIRSRVSGKHVTFDTDLPLDEHILQGLPITSMTKEGSKVNFFSPAPEAVLARIFATGASLSNLTVTGAALEDAFVHLTSEEDR